MIETYSLFGHLKFSDMKAEPDREGWRTCLVMATMSAAGAGDICHGASCVHYKCEFLRRCPNENPARIVSAFKIHGLINWQPNSSHNFPSP